MPAEFNHAAALAGLATFLNEKTVPERFSVHKTEGGYPVTSIHDAVTGSHLYLVSVGTGSYWRTMGAVKHGLVFQQGARQHALGYEVPYNRTTMAYGYAEPKVNVGKILARLVEAAEERKAKANADAVKKNDAQVREAFARVSLPILVAKLEAAGFAVALLPRFQQWGDEHALLVGTEYGQRYVYGEEQKAAGTNYVQTSAADPFHKRSIDAGKRLFECPIYIRNEAGVPAGAVLTFGEGKVRPDSLARLIAVANALRGGNQ